MNATVSPGDSFEGSIFKVVLIGSGEINFGSREGSWNHTLRLERALKDRLRVLALIDPDLVKAKEQIQRKRDLGLVGYSQTKCFIQISDAKIYLADSKIDLIIVGSPPHVRGTVVANADQDLVLLDSLYADRFLVEKPISALPPTVENGHDIIAKAYKDSGAVVGVGLMLKGLKAVSMMRDIIEEHGLVIRATAARYYMAYEFATKPSWWNRAQSCGPIVEQAAHLLLLSLYFGGPVDHSTIKAHSVLPSDAAGRLDSLGFDEAGTISPDAQLPRFHTAIWKYQQTGAVGSLSHAIAFHDNEYTVEFEVICDGYYFKLFDVYTDTPKLTIRRPKTGMETLSFDNDDPYQSQLNSLICNQPICSYQEGLDVYKLSWAIRQVAEHAEQAYNTVQVST